MSSDDVNYKETRYGFEFGSMVVERMASDGKRGWAVVSVNTPKGWVQIYATKTGKVRVSVHQDGNRCGEFERKEAKGDE